MEINSEESVFYLSDCLSAICRSRGTADSLKRLGKWPGTFLSWHLKRWWIERGNSRKSHLRWTWVGARLKGAEARWSNRGRQGWGSGQCLTAPPILGTTSFKFIRTSLAQDTRAASLDPEDPQLPQGNSAHAPRGAQDLPLRKPSHPRAPCSETKRVHLSEKTNRCSNV